MLVMLGGVSPVFTGVSKKGNPYTAVMLQTCWEDAGKRGFACDALFWDVLFYDRFLKKYVEDGGQFPILANASYDPTGHLISLELLDTEPTDIMQFLHLSE